MQKYAKPLLGLALFGAWVVLALFGAWAGYLAGYAAYHLATWPGLPH